MLALTRAVLLQVANPQVLEARSLLTDGLTAMDAALDEFEHIITTRLYEHAAKPHTGLRAESAEQPGPDGLHAVTVVSVIPGGPAAAVDVRAGDRLTAIGRRTLAHEPSDLIHMLLHSEGGPIVLTLDRDGKVQLVKIDRKPIPCLTQAVDHLDRERWLERIDQFRLANDRLKKALAAIPDSAMAQFIELNDHYQQLQSMLQQSVAIFQTQLGLETIEACGVS